MGGIGDGDGILIERERGRGYCLFVFFQWALGWRGNRRVLVVVSDLGILGGDGGYGVMVERYGRVWGGVGVRWDGDGDGDGDGIFVGIFLWGGMMGGIMG